MAPVAVRSVRHFAVGRTLLVARDRSKPRQILQKDAPENLVTSVPVYASVTGKQLVFLGRVFADGEETPFRLAAPAGARKIVLDPYETVLTQPK